MLNARKFKETIVISTRIRLARNFASYPFPKKMNETQCKEIVNLARERLRSFDQFTEYNIATISKEKQQDLQERYLISAALAKSPFGAAFVIGDNSISVMVNEEDHLRMQCIRSGLNLLKAYEGIEAVDEWLSESYDFAFDRRLGFLTACPSNLGTGMRASVMLFLPGLALTKSFKNILPEIKRRGMTVRGAFGEGSYAEGFVYQVSNERTLGWSTAEIMDVLEETLNELCKAEFEACAKLLKESETELKDRCLRSFGVLTNCAILEEKEFLTRMTDVRLGMSLGFIEPMDMKGFNDFLNNMRPASFLEGNHLDKNDKYLCDTARAETVCRTLPELVRIVGRRR